MKKWYVICTAIVTLLIAVCGCTMPQCNDHSSAETAVNGTTTAYFNGEIIEVTKEYLYVKPIEEWQWQEVSKVKLPLKDGFEVDASGGQCGDIVRVAFNSDYMEWGEDEVALSVIFQIYDRTEEYNSVKEEMATGDELEAIYYDGECYYGLVFGIRIREGEEPEGFSYLGKIPSIVQEGYKSPTEELSATIGEVGDEVYHYTDEKGKHYFCTPIGNARYRCIYEATTKKPGYYD